MSRYKGNDDACPHCGMKYRSFKTGFGYYDIFVLLMDYSEDSREWKYKRRNTVLGKWFQIKQQMWNYHINEGGCLKDPRNANLEPEFDELCESLEEAPF